MAEKLTKSITEKKPKFPKEKPIFSIPEKKPKERMPKIIKAKNPDEKRPRNGFIQAGLDPNKRSKIIKDGRKIK